MLLYFGYLLEIGKKFNFFPSKSGELGSFFSQKSFVCVEIKISRPEEIEILRKYSKWKISVIRS
jgi:hypothetical protein